MSFRKTIGPRNANRYTASDGTKKVLSMYMTLRIERTRRFFEGNHWFMNLLKADWQKQGLAR